MHSRTPSPPPHTCATAIMQVVPLLLQPALKTEFLHVVRDPRAALHGIAQSWIHSKNEADQGNIKDCTNLAARWGVDPFEGRGEGGFIVGHTGVSRDSDTNFESVWVRTTLWNKFLALTY